MNPRTFSSRNPKSEIRNPKEIRSPKSEAGRPACHRVILGPPGGLAACFGSWIPASRALAAAILLFSIFAAPAADLSKLVAEASKYQSGLSAEPLRQIEQLVRDSAGSLARRVELEAALIKLLAPSATFEVRRFACQQLAVVGTDVCLPALAELLKTDDTVGIACLALGNIPSPRVDELLRNALLTTPGTNRIPVIDALGNRRDGEAAKSIANLVEYRRRPVAEAAILALGKIANKTALEALATLRQDTNAATVQVAARASLVAADHVAASDPKTAVAIYEELVRPAQPAHVRRAAFEAMLRLDTRGAEKRMLVALHGADMTLKPSAIAAVRTLPARNASVTFGKELARLQPAEQLLLIDALAARGDAGARTVIQGQVAAANPTVRRAAIRALGSLGDASTVPVLTKALAANPTEEDRQAVEAALVNLKGGDAVDRALSAALKEKTAVARASIVSVLGKRGSRGAVQALLTEAESTDTAIAQSAFQALGRVAGANDLEALADRLLHLKAPAARDAAENALTKTLARTTDADQRTAAVCGGLKKADDLDTRLSFIRLLPACGTAAALERLTAAASETDVRVSNVGVRTLAEWPDASAWDALAKICRQPGSDLHRTLALRALVRLAGDENARPSPALIERYRTLLAGAKSDDDRKLILGALSGCAHPDALALSLPLLSNPALKSEASLAVKKIAEAVKDKHPQAAQEALEKLK